MRAFNGYEVAVELRHRSWSDRVEETQRLLEAFGAAWAWIDEPKFRDSVRQGDIATVPLTSGRPKKSRES